MTHETALGRIKAVLNTHVHALIAGVITTVTGWLSYATDFLGATATPWLIGAFGAVAAASHHAASWTTHTADGVRTVRGNVSRWLHTVAAMAPPAVAAAALNIDAFLGAATDPVLGLLAAAHHVAASLTHIAHSVPEARVMDSAGTVAASANSDQAAYHAGRRDAEQSIDALTSLIGSANEIGNLVGPSVAAKLVEQHPRVAEAKAHAQFDSADSDGAETAGTGGQ